jgi:hypothetical protein
MSLFTASLYLLCIAFLFGSALFVYSQNPFARLNIYYAVLAFGLLGWVATLFVFNTTSTPIALLWLGRLNFAPVPIVATASYLFVRELAGKPVSRSLWLWAETCLLAIISATTGLIDKAELLVNGQHVTEYGPLFIVYVLQIVGLLIAAVVVAFQTAPGMQSQRRLQLLAVGSGILATLVVATVTNVVLPYAINDFAYINLGTLSTVLFLAAVTYATLMQHLFNIRVIIKATVVTAILVGLALELYQASIGFLTQLLPLKDPAERSFAAAAVALIINAFLHEPVKAWLERIANRFLRRSRRRSQVATS